ncbi:hypothetical protein [Halorussus sp. GCM10023401]
MAVSRQLALFGVFGASLAFAGVAVAQEPFGATDFYLSPFERAAANFVFTLFVGGAVLTLGHNYFDSVRDHLRLAPGSSFLWGLGVLVTTLGVGVLLTLFLGGIGRLVFTALLLGFVLVAVVGRVVAYLVLFGWLVDRRWLALGLTAVVGAVFLVVPPLGTVAELLVASTGTGAMFRNYWY